jgi:hypothetical protein
MVRKHFFITLEQKLLVNRRAALTGVSQAEIIRRIIDLELEQVPLVAEERRQTRQERRQRTQKHTRVR